ncbi:MAG: class E sortase [Rubrobacter sp.]
MRVKRLSPLFVVLALAATLSACGVAGSAGDAGNAGRASGGEAPPDKGRETSGGVQVKAKEAPKMTEKAKDRQVAPVAGNGGGAETEGNKLQPAEDKTLRLTVPKMAEIKNDEIPTGRGTNEALLRDNAAIRLPFTGFPWQEEANIYIAGHRIGFPGTDSDLAFYDLDKVGEGDEVYLEDAEGRRYTYEVFETKVVEPTDLSVLKRVEGKNVVTLQTCTLPDYTKRLIVSAELKDMRGA